MGDLMKMAGMALAVALFVGSPAPAEAAQPGQWNFELYGGWYLVGDLGTLSDLPGSIPESLEALGLEPGDDFTFGLRFGKRQAEKWGWQVSAGNFDADDALERLENQTDLSINLVLVDLSFLYHVGGGNFFVYGGPGFASLDLDVNGVGPGGPLEIVNIDETETNFSIHAGLGYSADIGSSAFLRFDSRFRYIDADVYEGDTDVELTLAIGWNFGG